MTINIDRYLDAGEVPGLTTQTRETFTPTAAQTAFILGAAPSLPNDTMLFVNNAKYLLTTDFSVFGSTLTWLDTAFTLDTNDVVEVIYYV